MSFVSFEFGVMLSDSIRLVLMSSLVVKFWMLSHVIAICCIIAQCLVRAINAQLKRPNSGSLDGSVFFRTLEPFVDQICGWVTGNGWNRLNQ